MSAPTVLHLKTQRNQPYGSERRCCEECGTMIWGNVPIKDGGRYTDDPKLYESPPDGYVRCRDVGRRKQE